MNTEKRPLHLAVKSLVIFARTISAKWWGAKIRLQRQHFSTILSRHLAVTKRNKMATMREEGPKEASYSQTSYSLNPINKHVLLIFHSNSVQDWPFLSFPQLLVKTSLSLTCFQSSQLLPGLCLLFSPSHTPSCCQINLLECQLPHGNPHSKSFSSREDIKSAHYKKKKLPLCVVMDVN